ncbi:MAG: hypothetical protein BGO27_08385 [Alphaproteobacteria bacterium 33-17]|nr:MAG: hypothetical protein BGO27_08385 [Alphaproteobacteria bacterium 33-17]
MLLNLIKWLVDFAHSTGYLGIFIMTFLESTFLPIPSEITMIPAGYLIYQDVMNPFAVLASSISGTILGSCFSYFIALKYGRMLIIKFGKYFFMNEDKLKKIEDFFAKHGSISTFTGRLIPGVRHFISFPAGLAKMNLTKFCLYTSAGGSLWVITLLALGYKIGENEELISEWITIITIAMLALCSVFAAWYIKKNSGKK